MIFNGNAAIERGFSANKECIIEHQNEVSLSNIKHVHDGGIENIIIIKKN